MFEALFSLQEVWATVALPADSNRSVKSEGMMSLLEVRQ